MLDGGALGDGFFAVAVVGSFGWFAIVDGMVELAGGEAVLFFLKALGCLWERLAWKAGNPSRPNDSVRPLLRRDSAARCRVRWVRLAWYLDSMAHINRSTTVVWFLFLVFLFFVGLVSN